VKEVTGNMMDVLQNSDNPKWRNCKMLKFLKKLNQGAYKIDGDQLVKSQEKLEEFRLLEMERSHKEEELKRL